MRKNIKNESAGFDWKSQFPDVPEQVHQSVVNALEQLDDTNASRYIASVEKQKRISFWRKGVVLAAALVALVGSTTAIATEYFKWHEQALVDLQNPSQDMQNKLTDMGLASQQEGSATLGGLTITAEQVVQDENTLYILLKLTADEPIIGGDWSGFRKRELQTDEGEVVRIVTGGWWYNFTNGTSYYAPLEDRYTKEGYISLIYHSNDVGKLDYDHLQICFTDYVYDKDYNPTKLLREVEGKIEGSWVVPLTLNPEAAKKLTKVYEMDVEVPLDAKPYTVKEVTVTPFSIDMLVEASKDKEKIQEYAEKYERWMADGPVGYHNKAFQGVRYADGTIVDLSWGYSGGGIGSSASGQDHWHTELRSPIDSENVTALLFGENGEICIELK